MKFYALLLHNYDDLQSSWNIFVIKSHTERMGNHLYKDTKAGFIVVIIMHSYHFRSVTTWPSFKGNQIKQSHICPHAMCLSHTLTRYGFWNKGHCLLDVTKSVVQVCIQFEMIYIWHYNGARHIVYMMKMKTYPRHWPLMREIHWSPGIPLTKTRNAELWCFLWSAPKHSVE